jgi:uncharacterized protein (TIGR00725 family)
VRIKIGVMGSADDSLPDGVSDDLREQAQRLGHAIASHDAVLLTGATTGLIYVVGRAAQQAGALHIGISPASNEVEHKNVFDLPTEACDAIIYTGFGLKGRNVVLVRSCDIVLFIAGAMGSLNEFTIAHDEGKVVGCLKGTGGVADEMEYLLKTFSKETGAQMVTDMDPERLLKTCLALSLAKPDGVKNVT